MKYGLLLTAALALPLTAAEVPRPAPKMVFPTTDGGKIDTSEHKGKVIALAFILTTCPHCQDTCAALQRVQNALGPRGVQTYAVATNAMSHMLIPDFIKNFGVRFPVGYAEGDKAHEYLQHPSIHIMYYPQLVFIDKKGMIRKQVGGGDAFFEKKTQEINIRNEMEKLLAEPAGAAAKPVTSAPKPASKPVTPVKKAG
ncbi:MAG: TlpA family protein disulfide reductase [Acidobacteria bacterium]|nr:TlpA family protein disulfide reductase [Acidobacteriota bacterium]